MTKYNAIKSKKRLGQHFLQDPAVIDHIVAIVAPRCDQHLVEIGPGLGAITYPLATECQQLDLIEMDARLLEPLLTNAPPATNIVLHHDDALQFDFNKVQQQNKKLRIVGNLPYNISTPLIFHLINYVNIIEDMTFMLQKEVVQRMTAQPGNHHYGRLSVMLQIHCQATPLFTIEPHAFSPPPKVTSQMIHLKPHADPPYTIDHAEQLSTVVRLAFNQRRKILRNSLRTCISAQALMNLNIDPHWRAEQLSIAQFVQIANSL